MRHFINILDHSTDELTALLDTAARLKARMKRGERDLPMQGKTLAMYFQKPSLRTRVSLEVAINSMGGSTICMEVGNQPLGARESIPDQARVMSRFVDVISMRTFDHAAIEEMARWSTVPVINVLSDWSHPTQAMADILTMREHLGDLAGRTLTYVGDGNNVARSLASLCARLGIRFVCSSPAGYELDAAFLDTLRKASPDACIELEADPHRAVSDAAAVYTDVWASMGQETEAEARLAAFRPYQVNTALMQSAPAGTIVLHCLPAHRGDEITDEVMDSPASVVFDQAENRMHINRALFATLVPHGREPSDA